MASAEMDKQTFNNWHERFQDCRLLAYGGSLLCVGAALLLTHVLFPLQSTPTVLFFAAVVTAAWVGGRGPAYLAILCSILAVDFFFVHLRISLLSELGDLARFSAFTLVALLICYLQDSYKRIATQLRQVNDILESRVQERTSDLIATNNSLMAEIRERRNAENALKESEAKLRVAMRATEAALKEKEVLLRELRHRVKNNLQLVSSLLSLHRSKLQDHASRELFQECQQRVRAIALVHEELYAASSPCSTDLTTSLRKLIQNLIRCYGFGLGIVTPKIVVEDVVLGIDHLIPCALIINELVCNALKYAFPDGRSGEVRVEVRRRDGHISLLVADDGVGFSPSEVPHRSGVGRQIVQALVDQISGTIQWGNGRGTSATVTFPERNEIGGKCYVSESDPGG